jgi:hypothetical protein
MKFTKNIKEIFLICVLGLALVNSIELKSSLKSSNLLENIKKSDSHHSILNPPKIDVKESISHTPIKQESTKNSEIKQDSHLKSQKDSSIITKDTRISSNNSSDKGFFTKTSKQNRSVAAEALAGFILGFILFFISIQLICFNERRSVKYTQFIDWVNNESNVIYVPFDSKITEIQNEKPRLDSKAYIVSGDLKVEKECTIDGFEIPIRVEDGKILFISFHYEQWIKEEKPTGRTIIVNGEEQDEYKVEEKWGSTLQVGELYKNKIFQGEATLSGLYTFDLSRIEYLIDTPFVDNSSNTFRLEKSQTPMLESYIKNTLRDTSNLRIEIENEYVYILRDSLRNDGSEFNSSIYRPSGKDRRMFITYHVIRPEDRNQFTLGGKLSEPDKLGRRYVSGFNSEIHQAEWNYYLCCCGESEEFYKIDMCYSGVLTRQDIVSRLTTENNCCTNTLRVVGFLMHFGSYYLILYPIILLVGMIPFLGAVGAVVLIFFAFIMSLITFLFIIACAWIFARPLLALIIFGIIGILVVISKLSRDHIVSQQQGENKSDARKFGEIIKEKFL